MTTRIRRFTSPEQARDIAAALRFNPNIEDRPNKSARRRRPPPDEAGDLEPARDTRGN